MLFPTIGKPASGISEPCKAGQNHGRIEKKECAQPMSQAELSETGIIMLGCNLAVIPDPEQGIMGGSATSNSLFNFGKLPGYQTGSFWTVRIDLDK